MGQGRYDPYQRWTWRDTVKTALVICTSLQLFLTSAKGVCVPFLVCFLVLAAALCGVVIGIASLGRFIVQRTLGKGATDSVQQ